MITLSDRIRGGIYGLLIGDALGVPFEFKNPADIPPLERIDFDLPQGYDRSHDGVPTGTWSDDGAQALCLLTSLLERDTLDLADLGRRFCDWYTYGYLAVDNKVFDVGITTGQAIRRMLSGVPAARAGSVDDYANGNGSLMRVLPLVLWHCGDDASLISDAHEQSLPTHGHIRSQVCCALYCLWARHTLRATTQPWSDAVAVLRRHYQTMPDYEAELEFHVRPDDHRRGNGSGYVVDALISARWTVEQGDFATVVRSAIRLGDDTDTTACLAGGIAGLRVGAQGLPESWLQKLRARELVEPLVDRLVARLP